MTIFINSNKEDFESPPIGIKTNQITIQISTVGGERGANMPTIEFLVKLPDAPSGSPSTDADFSIVEPVKPNGVYKLTLPTGTEVKVRMYNNTRKCNVRVWGTE